MSSKIIIAFVLLTLLFITKNWFIPVVLTSGDLPYYFNTMYGIFSFFPLAWDLQRGEGLGGSYLPFLWGNITTAIPINVLGSFGLNWITIERLVFFYPFLILSFFSSYWLAKKVVSSKNIIYLAPFLYILNTYILLIVGGGQMQIALAYSVMPFVLGLYIDLMHYIYEKKQIPIRLPLIMGLLLALQTAMDTRIVFVTLVAILLYIVLNLFSKDFRKLIVSRIKSLVIVFLLPFIIVLLLHLFWLLPIVLFAQNPVEQLGSNYSSIEAVKFFSTAKFENSFSLLHPNWPENLFGKTYFMRAEFLILPLLAFSALLFLPKNKRERMHIFYLLLLGLVGAFLAKGANDPFGFVYLWLFENVPGFSLFRDPTKWYPLVAIAYSILIPYTLNAIYKNLSGVKRLSFTVLILLLLLFLLRPAFSTELKGTFQSVNIPTDYIKLERLLSSQQEFSRTLWVPSVARFGFYSLQHPAISGQNFFYKKNLNELLYFLQEDKTRDILIKLGVKYVIVLYDAKGEIYLTDRKYDERIFKNAVEEVSQIPWLKRVEGFENLAVFETRSRRDHFWTDSPSTRISYTSRNPTYYTVRVVNAQKGESVVFSESYSAVWSANILDEKNLKLENKQYEKRFNSFILPKDGNYTFEVTYKPQNIVAIGSGISVIVLLLVIGGLFINRKI